ncbi:CD225/dispanin family protein [Dysgonomonas sp. Marseille-P4677]|uniref:CD225/dispanin family protein n=1 Tax=Dysgonomonas sp. Marseille-P4677 TaxID=2364790 RepID=UPI001913F7B9|nr:CD225/dispanin family protein [Dysgonomonas sp. Marseille-P4677]MBK5720244.1 CD225/dispanin family protein [Dysgonomonas sp. Marseille-P4677]
MTELDNPSYQDPAQQTNAWDSEVKPEKPNNNLALAIIATIVSLITCCGWVSCVGVILGIIAIVFSTQVDSKYFAGDYAGAESSAKNAKLLSLIAIGTVVLSIVWIIISIVMAGGIAAIMEQYETMMEAYR